MPTPDFQQLASQVVAFLTPLAPYLALGAGKVAELKTHGQIAAAIDPDILRLAFVSLAMTPMLLKEIFEEQMERPMDGAFLHNLAAFNGHLFAAGLAPSFSGKEGEKP